jgi:hypothetical protein
VEAREPVLVQEKCATYRDYGVNARAAYMLRFAPVSERSTKLPGWLGRPPWCPLLADRTLSGDTRSGPRKGRVYAT